MTIVAKCRCAGSRRGTDESGEPWFEWPRGSNVIGGARSASGRPRPMAARRCFDARRSMLTRNFWRPRSRATAGTGATIPLLARSRVLRRGGHVRPASRVPPARPRRTREAPQAAGPGGGAEFVTEPRDHHIEDSPLSREFESTGDAVSTWDCSLLMGYRAVTGSGRFRTGVKSIRHWSRFTSQAFVKRHYIKLHTCKMYNIRTTDARDHL